eukprot:TRINITY_DN21164_c0_g1_i1.p1 TRINITY_DN21164_c0_g1~~TRINITY_DN21164_c0_g1_i1.p1  ORF type:complete len:680 (-),score=120.72 TRINITY_DN21164_c0_g1_i1:12-2051(-)
MRPPTDFQDLSLRFSEEDLVLATNQFAPDRLLGRGSHGSVYRGRLRDGYEVAVKVLAVKHGYTDVSGFADEIVVLSRYRHPNLVTLMGYGISQDSTYLVYELLAGGDVASRLQACQRRPFAWAARVEAARGACYGLSYLHGSTPRAFHRDVKSANILLDRAGNAKLADFGLAGIATSIDGDMACERVSGTPGYACPEYVRTGRISESSEVFSFGVVLLELLLNLRPAVMGSGGSTIFPILQTVLPQSADARQRTLAALDASAQWPASSAASLAQLALHSIAAEQQLRPGFRGIAEELSRIAEEGSETDSKHPGASDFDWLASNSVAAVNQEEDLPTKTWYSDRSALPATKTWKAGREKEDRGRDFGLDLPATCSLATTKQLEPPTKTWYSNREEPPTKTWRFAQKEKEKVPLLQGLTSGEDENKSQNTSPFAKAILKNLSFLGADEQACNENAACVEKAACPESLETIAGCAGNWRNSQGVRISVFDGKFTTDHGETGSVDWQNSSDCSLEFDGQICHGRLAADGSLSWSDGDVWRPEAELEASHEPAVLQTSAFEGRWASKAGLRISIRNAKVTIENGEVLGSLSSPDGRRCALTQLGGGLRRGWLAPDGSVRWCDRDIWHRANSWNDEVDAVASLRFEADPCSKTQDEIQQTWFHFLSERTAWKINPAEPQCTPVQR